MLTEKEKNIIKDHQKKSNQLKKAQRKLKNKTVGMISQEEILKKLQNRLQEVENSPIDVCGWQENDYEDEKNKKEGQIIELQHTIWMIQDMQKTKR